MPKEINAPTAAARLLLSQFCASQDQERANQGQSPKPVRAIKQALGKGWGNPGSADEKQILPKAN